MSNESLRLKPCPFCGGIANHTLIQTYSLDSSYYVISCEGCQCVFYASDDLSEQDVKDWNNRHNEDAMNDAIGWAIPALERYVDSLGLATDDAALTALYKCKDAVQKACGVPEKLIKR